jgi:transposase
VTLLASELKNRDLKIADLQHRLAGHNRHRFGAISESLDQLQLALENEEIAVAAVEEAEPSTPEAAGPEPKAKPRRKPLPDHLDRNETVIAPGDACARCGGDLKTLGEDVTPVKMLSPGNKRTKTARVWAYVRDERSWIGEDPPAAWHQFTVDRKGHHPVSHLSGYKGWVHADGYSGFNGVFGQDKASEMACMAHIRRKFVDVQQSQGSAIAEEAIRRIAGLYAIEKKVRGGGPDDRIALRHAKARPIFDDLEAWLRIQLPKISRKSPLATAIRYALDRLPKARPYLENGFLELDNNSVERQMKPVAIGRKNWTFAGSEGGGKAMAIAYTLIETAKLNGVNPQAWLTDTFGRIAGHKTTRLDELMPWRYAAQAA